MLQENPLCVFLKKVVEEIVYYQILNRVKLIVKLKEDYKSVIKV